jgi:hypothetical protein
MRNREPSHAQKSVTKGWLRAPGAPWSANPSWQWKTSSATSIDHEERLHTLMYNARNTVHKMADDPQPNKIPLSGSEPVREWLKELPEEERQDRQGPVASAMALAGRNAAVPRDGKWPLED